MLNYASGLQRRPGPLLKPSSGIHRNAARQRELLALAYVEPEPVAVGGAV